MLEIECQNADGLRSSIHNMLLLLKTLWKKNIFGRLNVILSIFDFHNRYESAKKETEDSKKCKAHFFL